MNFEIPSLFFKINYRKLIASNTIKNDQKITASPYFMALA